MKKLIFLGITFIALGWLACVEGSKALGDDDDAAGGWSQGGSSTGSGGSTTNQGGTSQGGANQGGSGGHGGSAQVTTIFEIQQGSVPTQTQVRLEGVVVTTGVTQLHSSCEIRAFWVQDPAGGQNSGIAVKFYEASLPGFTVSAGDRVNLEGEYAEYWDLNNIILKAADDFEVVTAGYGVPAPLQIPDPCAVSSWEIYEGVYVQIQNLTVSQTIADVGYGQFEVNSCFLVDSLFFPYTDCGGSQDLTPDPPQYQSITSITGPIHYTFSAYKIEPTGSSAFVGWVP